MKYKLKQGINPCQNQLPNKLEFSVRTSIFLSWISYWKYVLNPRIAKKHITNPKTRITEIMPRNFTANCPSCC